MTSTIRESIMTAPDEFGQPAPTSAGDRRPGRPGDLRSLRRGPQPGRGRADPRVHRGPDRDLAAGAARDLGSAAEAAGRRRCRTAKGIEVERPEPVGDYKVPDGRYLAGLTGRLVELFTDGVPTVCMSLYLSPHTIAVSDAVRVARGDRAAGRRSPRSPRRSAPT